MQSKNYIIKKWSLTASAIIKLALNTKNPESNVAFGIYINLLYSAIVYYYIILQQEHPLS